MPYTLNLFTGEFDYYQNISIGSSIIYGGTQGSVLFIGSSGVIQEDNSNFYWDDTNNRLGIGNIPANDTLADGKVFIYRTSTDISSQASGMDLDVKHAVTSNNSNTLTGINFVTRLDQNGNNLTSTQASRSAFFSARVEGSSGTVTGTLGITGEVRNTGAGILTNGTAFRAFTPVNSGSGTFTTYRGFLQDDLNSGLIGSGTAARAFEGQITAASNRYNLYMSGTAKNYLAGPLHIGTAPLVDWPLSLDASPVLQGTSYIAGVLVATHTASADFSESVTGYTGQTTLILAGFNATGTIAGLSGTSRITGSGTVNIASGVRGLVSNINGATITDAQSFRASVIANVGGGTITRATSLYAPDQTAGGTNYAIYSDQSTGYTIYAPGGAQSYLAGNLGIGVVSPGFLLDVQGPAAAIISTTGYADSASGGSFLGRKARGTQASPTKALADDKLSAWGGRGYVQGSGFLSTSSARFQIAAAEDYSSTSNLGSYMIFETTPIGSGTIREIVRFDSTGNVGIGVTSPTALIHLAAGTAAASTAPIKLTAGTFNTTAEAGTLEYNNVFSLTESDATRRYIVQAASSSKTSGVPVTDGYITVRINGTDVKLMTTA